MNNRVALGIFGNYSLLLVLLLLYGFLSLGLLVLILLCKLVVLLLILLGADSCQSGLLTLQLGNDGLQGLLGSCAALIKHLLYQRMV